MAASPTTAHEPAAATLNNIAAEWEQDIPPIEALVVNQNTGLPGPGFDGFLIEKGEVWANKRERRALIETYWTKIFAYPYWDDVLDELGIEQTPDGLGSIITTAGHGGGGVRVRIT